MAEVEDPVTLGRQRLSPDRRIEQLLDVAYRILSVDGPEGVQISEVAQQANVSRPLVYRFFANRTELLVAVLDDFERALSSRFQALVTGDSLPEDPREIAAMFVHCSCDLIEERGGGAWDLLMSRSTDKDVVAFSQKVLSRVMAPWYPLLEAYCSASQVPASVIADMLVAAGDTALHNWVHGRMSREVAVEACVRAISGILLAFRNDA